MKEFFERLIKHDGLKEMRYKQSQISLSQSGSSQRAVRQRGKLRFEHKQRTLFQPSDHMV